MPKDADALPTGFMIGAYRVDYRIGGGGMGTVYAAEEPTIHKRVAIKVLRHMHADDPSIAARFEREARAANGVNHPAIVDVFAFGKLSDGRPYLVMSMLEGCSLAEEIAKSGRIEPTRAWQWAREIGEALSAAHAAGIVHRDLKPDNVFIETVASRARRPRLLDLGLAKLMPNADDEAPSPMKLTQTGAPMGTPIYMAPEQWWGTEVDARVDQYAFGVTLFEMLTGRPPFQSQQFMELAQQHTSATPPSLASAGIVASVELEAFIAKTLAKSAGDRFPSMRELIETGNIAFASPDTDELPTADTVLGGRVERGSLGVALAGSSGKARNATATPEAFSLERRSDVLPRDPASQWRRFLLVLAVIFFLGPSALVLVGYAGAGRRALGWWLRDAGPPLLVIVPLFFVASVLVLRSARKRSQSNASSTLPWIAAALVAVSGAIGTYVGWNKTENGLDKLRSTLRFEILHQGVYELELSRFLGFYLAALLFMAIAASVGLGTPKTPKETLGSAVGTRSVESVALCAALVLLAILSLALGAASGALVAGASAFIIALEIAMPLRDATNAARDEIERALAGLSAFGLLVVVALIRVDARGAVAFGEQPTRAARVAEIVSANVERATTLWVAVVAFALVAVFQFLRFRRVWLRNGPIRPSLRDVCLLSLGLAVGVGDIVQHTRIASARDRLHDELAAEFTLFAELDPPATSEIDPKTHHPHPAPGFQISRKVVAVNAHFIAPLSAADSVEGSSNIGRELSRALAENSVRADDDSIDLSVSIDRRVPWSTVSRLLSIARSAGARNLEVLLTRGESFFLPEGAPPEASWVLSSDFVALRVDLGDDGWDVRPETSFGDATPGLIRLMSNSDEPIRIHADRR